MAREEPGKKEIVGSGGTGLWKSEGCRPGGMRAAAQDQWATVDPGEVAFWTCCWIESGAERCDQPPTAAPGNKRRDSLCSCPHFIGRRQREEANCSSCLLSQGKGAYRRVQAEHLRIRSTSGIQNHCQLRVSLS